MADGGYWLPLKALTVRSLPFKGKIPHPLRVVAPDRWQLLGYDLPAQAPPTGRVPLTLYWQALGQMDQDYTVFTHLIDSSNRIWAQQDSQPRGGQRPTSQWVEGDVVVDEYELVLGEGVPPGEYQIEVGLYDWVSGQRLAVSEGGQWVPESRVILGGVRLSGR